MVFQTIKTSELLRSLLPKDQEELSLLQFILHSAQTLQRGSALDIGLVKSATVALAEEKPGFGLPADVQNFLMNLPEDLKRYFHGLIEAVEIYHSIHGQPLPINRLTLTDETVYELRQIRDMCMEEGLRSIY
jgi:hypothetical protein